MLHLEYRRRRGWKRSWCIGGCEPVEYFYTWKWPRDGRMGRDKKDLMRAWASPSGPFGRLLATRAHIPAEIKIVSQALEGPS